MDSIKDTEYDKQTEITQFSSQSTKLKEEKQAIQIRLGIVNKTDLLKSNLQCIRALIIKDTIVIICAGLQMLM